MPCQKCSQFLSSCTIHSICCSRFVEVGSVIISKVSSSGVRLPGCQILFFTTSFLCPPISAFLFCLFSFSSLPSDLPVPSKVFSLILSFASLLYNQKILLVSPVTFFGCQLHQLPVWFIRLSLPVFRFLFQDLIFCQIDGSDPPPDLS